jgi:hypothetical protein
MPQQTKFYSYNIIRDEQRDRLKAVAIPVTRSVFDNSTFFNTYSLYQHINTQHTPITASQESQQHNLQHDNTRTPLEITQSTINHKRKDRDSDEDFNPGPSQRCRHRSIRRDLPSEQKLNFLRKLKSFKDKWNKMFPDKPCAECGTLLLPRNRKLKAFQDGHIYGITRVFNLSV